MLSQTIGVSPPLKGQAQDSKVDLKNDFKEASKGSYKNDFDKTLKEKLAIRQKDKKEADSTNKKEAFKTQKDDKELKAEEKEKKSSGGTKKKMTDKEDSQMVSNGMASQEVSKESAVEIPEFTTDLAEESENLKVEENPLQAWDRVPLAEPSATDVASQAQMVGQLGHELATDAAAAKPYTFEQELGAQVGFQSATELAQQAGEKQAESSNILQKMKSFEAEKNMSVDKAQAFEKSVLDKLQQLAADQGVPVVQVGAAGSETAKFGESQSEGQGAQSGEDSGLKDLKDLKGAEGPQHAGQSHGDFKTHLGVSSAGVAGETKSAADVGDGIDKNIKDIISQGQLLVKKGGGEMTVRMSPDGLGEVQLKVMLQDGKVNIEMHTQDKSVKKLIEDSLTELKSGLAAHQLSIDHVKIDTVNATNTENNTQFNSNQQHQQAGSNDRGPEFWNRFQENQNQNRRSSYGSVGGAGAGAGAKAAATERSTTAAEGSLRTYGGTKGSQFNRVA